MFDWRRLLTVGMVCCSIAAYGQRLEIGSCDLPPQGVVDALGSWQGKPCRTGFVFINGLYVKPPYTVEYKGNGIYLNGQLIDCPLAFDSSKSGGTAPAQKAVNTSSKPSAGGDDFFSFDDASVSQPKTAPSSPSSSESEDAFLLDEDEVKSAKATAAAPKPVAESVQLPPADVLVRHRQSMARLAKIYDDRLQQGCLLMVGRTHTRTTGTYQTGRQLIEALPTAMRASHKGRELLKALQSKGIYFLDEPVCDAIMRNRLSFIAIDQRRTQILTESVSTSRR